VKPIDAVVESVDRKGGLAWLRAGKGRIAAAPWPGAAPGKEVQVRVAPGEVVLCAFPPGVTSARNVLPCRVQGLRMVPGGAEVRLDAGFPLSARITRSAVREMGLRRGSSVFALVKAGAVVPARDRGGPVPGALVGRLPFLRVLGEEGSIAAAARACGVSYRTGWLWARALDRALGAAVIQRTRGGRGGGGVSLTPEGRALLRRLEAAGRSLNP
jgi:molybdate transport repressor ModE-like protein/molybdopterin-binding protein